MKTVNLVQGTPEWHAHRAQHLNASDAPAMMGLSPYKSRGDLVREIATGITPEVDANTQRLFDDGHRSEALARPLAERIIGEDLYPCTGVDGKYSASFDGLSLMGDVAWEHKRLNDRLRKAMIDGCTGADLPIDYRIQMESQAKVSGAERILFMASHWDHDGNLVEERHCWYAPEPELRAKIVAGWEQLEADVAGYVPEAAAAPAAAGRAPDSLPALRVEVTGMVTASNLAEFKSHALQVLGSINRDLQTDDDFANAEETVKWCRDVEGRLAATKDAVLAQTADIEAVFRTMDEVSAEARRIRLELDKLVKAEKESRKSEIVAAGVAAVRGHLDAINATLGEHAIGLPVGTTAEFGAAIKGKRTIASIRDAVDTTAANTKVTLSQQAERVRGCVAVLADFEEHAALFPDRVALCGSKVPEDLRNLAAARVAEHQQREAEKLEAERERIRQEEAARLERERAAEEVLRQKREQLAALEAQREAEPEKTPDLPDTPHNVGDTEVASIDDSRRRYAPTGQTVKLGDINAALAPLSITAAGLSQLGFEPAGRKGNAQLYRASDFPRMCAAIALRVSNAASRLDVPEAA